MPAKVEHCLELAIIEFTFWGQVTGDELAHMMTQGLPLVKKHAVSEILMDGSEVVSPPSVFDIVDLPDYQFQRHLTRRGLRISVVLPREQKSRTAAHFFETVCLNRGWSVQLFECRDDAIKWLQGTDSTKS